jgi:hypothetical protein
MLREAEEAGRAWARRAAEAAAEYGAVEGAWSGSETDALPLVPADLAAACNRAAEREWDRLVRAYERCACGCGVPTLRRVLLLREQDAGTYAALGGTACGLAMRERVPLREECSDPPGYLDPEDEDEEVVS